ncbi:sodium-dependent lysophosphatidylcholine symporter 1-like [Branchiostoma floridae x Branchiostoma belcheri]
MADDEKSAMTPADDVEVKQKLTLREKLCYGVGMLTGPMMIDVLGIYCNVFLVEVAQIPPLFVSAIVFTSRFWDVIANLIVAKLIDKTNTRWGRMMPWVLGAGILLVPVYFLLWYVPDFGTNGKVTYYFVLYLAMVLLQTSHNVPYRTLAMYMSEDPKERDAATLFRSLFEMVAIVAGVAIHGQIVAAFDPRLEQCKNVTNGNSTVTLHSLEKAETGYMVAAGSLCGVAILATAAVVFGVRERKDIVQEHADAPDEPFLKSMKEAITFRPNVDCLVVCFCFEMAMLTLEGTSALFVQYSLDLVDHVQNVLLVFVISVVFFMPVVDVLVEKFGKRKTFMVSSLASIPLYIACQFLPARSVAATYPVVILLGFIGASPVFIPWTMVTDVVDDYRVKTGKQLDTIFFSLSLFAFRLAAAVALGLTAIALKIGGYITGYCVQPAEVGSTLRLLMSVVPIGLTLIGLIFLWRYPITTERQQRNKAALEEMKKAKNQEECKNGKLPSSNDEKQQNQRLLDVNSIIDAIDESARDTDYDADFALSSDVDLSHLEDSARDTDYETDFGLASDVDLTLLKDCKETTL